MNAEALTKALGGRWSGSSGMVCCPNHDDRTPSLSVCDGDDGRLLTHCFSGCSAEAVWAAIRDRGLAAEDRGVGHAPRCPPRAQPISINGATPGTTHAIDIWHKPRSGRLSIILLRPST